MKFTPEHRGETYTLKPDTASVQLMGHKPGDYVVQVGDYGWDDGDLFIVTNKGKLKLRDIT